MTCMRRSAQMNHSGYNMLYNIYYQTIYISIQSFKAQLFYLIILNLWSFQPPLAYHGWKCNPLLFRDCYPDKLSLIITVFYKASLAYSDVNPMLVITSISAWKINGPSSFISAISTIGSLIPLLNIKITRII